MSKGVTVRDQNICQGLVLDIDLVVMNGQAIHLYGSYMEDRKSVAIGGE